MRTWLPLSLAALVGACSASPGPQAAQAGPAPTPPARAADDRAEPGPGAPGTPEDAAREAPAAERFRALDTDDDHRLDRREWAAGVGALGWQAWDGDGDGRLSAAELHRGLFGAWDADGDGALDLWETRQGLAFWTPSAAAPAYADWQAWDADGDGRLDLREFGAAFGGTWRVWDVDDDDHLGGPELADGLFTAWDRDQSAAIDPYEVRWP